MNPVSREGAAVGEPRPFCYLIGQLAAVWWTTRAGFSRLFRNGLEKIIDSCDRKICRLIGVKRWITIYRNSKPKKQINK